MGAGVLKARVGGSWVNIIGSGMSAETARWNSAWGVVATVQSTTTQAVSTLVDITGLSVTFTPVAGRRYVASTGSNYKLLSSVTLIVDIQIRDGSNTVIAANNGQVPGAGWVPFPNLTSAPFSPPGGVPYTVKVSMSTNTGNVSINPGPAYPFLTVEDVGPVIYNAAPAPIGTPTAWTAVTFQNGWSDFGAPYQTCQYRLVGDRVEVRGLMKSGTIGVQAAFFLPVGYRPPARLQFPTQANGVFGWLSVDPTGTLSPENGSNAAFNVNCSFSVTP